MTATSALFGLLALEVASPPSGDPPPRGMVASAAPARERPGFTVSIGSGTAYGNMGGMQLRYDWPLRPWLHLAPFAGGGVTFVETFAKHGAAGVTGSLGRGHRLTADVAVAPIAWLPLYLHGTVVDLRAAYGPMVAIGYEHMSRSGWMQRVTTGYGWGLWGLRDGSVPSGFTLTFGCGMRVW